MAKSTRSRPSAASKDSLNSREAILAAAQKIFSRNGYDGTSMPKIAKLAQVAPPLIHYYFGSKENLWRETVARSLGDLHRDTLAISRATRALAPLDQLRVFLQSLAQHAARWPDNFVMIIAEARADSDRFAWVQEHFTGEIFGQVVSILEAARDRKLIKNVDFEQLASLLVGGVLVFFTVHANGEATSDPEQIDRISTEFTDLMMQLVTSGIAR